MIHSALSRFFVASIFLLASVAGIVSADDWDPQRLEATTVATQLVQPMELAIAPDGKIFLIELSGTIKLIDPLSKEVKNIGKLEVTTAQENGLIGLALDPQFEKTPWVYLQYSPPEFSGQQISRFLFRNGTMDLTSEQKIFRYEEQRRECCHHAGSMTFGPDGCLYIGTGDNTNPFGSNGHAPIDDQVDREPWDAQRTSGNTKSYNGKILRIRPNPEGGYSIPDGNLFPKDGSEGYPEIYVMGCRNPWRISVDAKTGYLYWGDVGPDAGSDSKFGPRGYDEVNQARRAGNFGWPYFIGPNRAYPIYDFASKVLGEPLDSMRPINRSRNNTGSQTLPPAQPAWIYYPAGASAEFPEVGTGGRTACAGPVYYFDESSVSETKLPKELDRTMFAYEWSRHWIMAVHLDHESNLRKLEPFAPHIKIVRPIDMAFDKLGRLYVIEYGETWGVNPEAKLLRIEYVRGNRNPVVRGKIENNVGREPLRVVMDATGSFDKDQNSLTYVWKSISVVGEEKKEQTIGQGLQATYTFQEPGVYTVALQVSDGQGGQDTTTFPVVVGNARPSITFLQPQDGDFHDLSEEVAYQLLVEDLEDGTSDFAKAERLDIATIESKAPSRTFVQARPYVPAKSAGSIHEPAGLALMRKSDCFNCHALDRALVGPMFSEVAKKYKGVDGALEKSIARVREGSTGVWGKVAMLPHAQHSVEDIRTMVSYVYSVETDARQTSVQGFRGKIPVAKGMDDLELEAIYTDVGRDAIPALSTTQVIRLRSRIVQAERADEIAKVQVLASDKAQGKAFIGGINHGGYVKVASVPLNGVKGVKLFVASAGGGGIIEIHRRSVDGPLLGETSVEVNGDWESFYEKVVSWQPVDAKEDLYFVFRNEAKPSGLMNLDAIEFLRP